METPKPTRFLLTSADMAAGFKAAGVKPPGSRFYDGLPAPVAAPSARLAKPDGSLTPEASSVFQLLARPKVILALQSVSPPGPLAFLTRFVGGTVPGHFVMATRDGDDWDLALLTSNEQVLALLDDLTGASVGPTADSTLNLELTSAGLLALAALTDLLARAEAREREGIARALVSFLSSGITINSLADAVTVAQMAPSTLQRVTVISILEGDARANNGQAAVLEQGMRNLVDQGLVDEESVLTAKGVGVCRSLTALQTACTIEIVSPDDGQVRLDRFLLLRTATALLAGLYASATPETATISMREISAVTLWRIISEGLESVPVAVTAQGASEAVTQPTQSAPVSNQPQQQFCTSCGAKLRAGAKFCSGCGAQVTSP